MRQLFIGSIMHHRLIPVEHKFDYKMPYIFCDIEEIDSDRSLLPLFAFNSRALFSLRESDYLVTLPGERLKERIVWLLKKNQCEVELSRFLLISTPRFLGYVFNPVSFILCLADDGKIGALISQVNNTFGECHIYFATDPKPTSSGNFFKFSRDKVFHVSPFNEVKGSYDFLVKLNGSTVDIRVNLLEKIQGQRSVKFRSYVRGKGLEMSKRNWLYLWRNFPVGGSFAIPLITYEAIKLIVMRKLSVFAKPIAQDKMTVRTAPASLLERFSEKIILNYFSKISIGKLRIEIADKTHTFGEQSAPMAVLRIKNRKLFSKMIFGGDMAFGEGFIEDYWDSPDIVLLLRTLAKNLPKYDNGEPGIAKLFRPIRAIAHRLNHNSHRNSRKNISAHYDLSNEFFATFLDESMTYSCALYISETDSLYDAQLNKIDSLLDKLNLNETHHLLEIGTGWGALAIRAAERFGCRVTSVTLSEKQLLLAQQRINAKGLQDKITLLLRDYRDLTGSYDRIVSVEMLEAVGHKYYPIFFAKLESLLAKNGLVAIQTITIPDQNYEQYRDGCDWIQKYIFPGGLCPSVSVLAETMARNSKLIIEEAINIGPHYAKTLSQWHQRFKQMWSEIEKLNGGQFDSRFFRIWSYYLSYCEAGFAERLLGTHQFLLTRAENSSLADAPGYDDEASELEAEQLLARRVI